MLARLALLLAALSASGAARAEADETGLVLGLRAGYGLPFGPLATGEEDVDRVVDAKVPLWIDLAYRFNARVQGGLYLELSPALVDDARCAEGATCRASDVRFGVAVRFHLAPRARLDPWVGAGFGIEVLRADAHEADPLEARVERTWAGVELPLEAGLDVRLWERLSVGPYVVVSLGRFTSLSERPEGGAKTSGSIDDRATHGWAQAGLQAVLRL